MNNPLTVALPKGRLGNDALKILKTANYGTNIDPKSRQLIFDDEAANISYLIVKPIDVITYVTEGVADVGIIGRDNILEEMADVYELLDLGFGLCRFSIAKRKGINLPEINETLRIATKYPNRVTDIETALANFYHYTPSNILVDNGSSAILDLIVRSFTAPEEVVLSFTPSFSMYQHYAITNNASFESVEGFDVDTLIETGLKTNAKVVILCNPNNPTGTLLKKTDIIRVLNSLSAIVVVDEAYMEFNKEIESMTPYINDYERLITPILKELVKKGKGLELNTSGIRYQLGFIHPEKAILKWYKALGGKIITIGSDAHDVKDYRANFEDAVTLLKETGFEALSIFKQRTPYFIKL